MFGNVIFVAILCSFWCLRILLLFTIIGVVVIFYYVFLVFIFFFSIPIHIYKNYKELDSRPGHILLIFLTLTYGTYGYQNCVGIREKIKIILKMYSMITRNIMMQG